jgi:hypothetical protein
LRSKDFAKVLDNLILIKTSLRRLRMSMAHSKYGGGLRKTTKTLKNRVRSHFDGKRFDEISRCGAAYIFTS